MVSECLTLSLQLTMEYIIDHFCKVRKLEFRKVKLCVKVIQCLLLTAPDCVRTPLRQELCLSIPH